MNINKIDRQVLKIINVAKVVRKVEIKPKEYRHMQEACYKYSEMMGQPVTKLQEITRHATPDNFTFLRTMMNKFNHQKSYSAENDSEHILNIYSMVEKPSVQHLNIVRKSNDSFESLEKIFALAKDKDSLQFVEDLQYGELRNAENPSKIIIDLLTSKNKDRYVANPERYSSYLELHANEEDAVKNLDSLIESAKFSKFRSDAQLAIKCLFKKQRIKNAMNGKSQELENMYTKDRAGFLSTLIKNFIPPTKAPDEKTKAVIVDIYGTLNPSNAKLRKAVIDRFKYSPVKDKSAEIIEMQCLFKKIDKDDDARSFVKKAMNKDLKINSISELNEILNSVSLKKANIFFNNAKRIIELAGEEERSAALKNELENPFFLPKVPQKAKIIRMHGSNVQDENILSKAMRYVENKINQYRYYYFAA